MTGGEVVVIGTTGRNFAAGMSGGIAYILDVDTGRVNTEMVDLEALDEASADVVRHLVLTHYEETGSEVAARLLADWPAARARFTRVMPRDYRTVLEAKAAAEDAGLTEEETTAAMMEAAHG
jgi:glutamate synthase (NADPH/NADH) large chain